MIDKKEFKCEIIEGKVFDDSVERLFSHCMYKSTHEKIVLVFKNYQNNSNQKIYFFKENDQVQALIAFEIQQSKILISHIATDEHKRSKKIASKLISYVSCRYPKLKLEAETDDDAVDFYKKIGFTITDLGEKYPGFSRYLCEKQN